MLETFTIDTFAPLEGQRFLLHIEGAEPQPLVLQSVTAVQVTAWRPEEIAQHRTPFSLLFLGPPTFILPQAIYRFEHDAIGAFEMFIVPIGQSAEGVSYEAIFS
jgi:hypothetical protein